MERLSADEQRALAIIERAGAGMHNFEGQNNFEGNFDPSQRLYFDPSQRVNYDGDYDFEGNYDPLIMGGNNYEGNYEGQKNNPYLAFTPSGQAQVDFSIISTTTDGSTPALAQAVYINLFNPIFCAGFGTQDPALAGYVGSLGTGVTMTFGSGGQGVFTMSNGSGHGNTVVTVQPSTCSYLQFLLALRTTPLHASLLRYSVANKAQYGNAITVAKKTMFGGFAQNQITVSGNQTPYQNQNTVVDVPIDEVVDQQTGWYVVVNPLEAITFSVWFNEYKQVATGSVLGKHPHAKPHNNRHPQNNRRPAPSRANNWNRPR